MGEEQSPTSVNNEYSFAADEMEVEEEAAAEGKNGRRRKALCHLWAQLGALSGQAEMARGGSGRIHVGS